VLPQFTDQWTPYPSLDLLVAHEDDARAKGEQDDDVHAAQGDHIHEHLVKGVRATAGIDKSHELGDFLTVPPQK